MFKMIRQFTFHHPKQIIAPTLWLFLSQAFSILPAILAYMAIYLLGQAFYPPYMELIAEAADSVLYIEGGKLRYHRNVLRQMGDDDGNS